MSEGVESTEAGAVTPAEGLTEVSNDWTSNLSEDHRGFVQTKGFQGVDSVLDSYKNLETLLGAPRERLVKLPDDSSDLAAMSEVYDKIGRPEAPEKYSFEDTTDTLKWAKKAFHEVGLSDVQARNLVEKFTEHNSSIEEGLNSSKADAIQQQAGALKSDWGAAYDQNVRIAKNATAALGIKPETIESMEEAMGFAEVMKLMHNIGSKVGESDFLQGSTAGVMTPDQAKYEIQKLEGDANWRARYLAKDKDAVDEMRRLDRMAYPSSS